jgi:protoporphyrin/coproporphyrin ferrochelatase
MSQKPLGVLVMAYGTPRNLDEVEAYYTHIRRGKPPTDALLAELKGRYEAIGGVSPLTEITQAQAQGLERILNQDGGRPTKVYLGMKHISPFIADGVQQMVNDGIEEAVTLVLAPHYATMSVAVYQKNAQEAADKLGGPKLLHVDSWHLQPTFIDVLAQRVAASIALHKDPATLTVIFSAHSLPERILTVGDPYPQQLHETGEAVAKQLGLKHYTFAWQSAGRTEEAWLGPDILDVIRRLHKDGVTDVVVCSAGFVSDHLEVLYDVDIECHTLAQHLGITLTRSQSMNADVTFLQALAEVVRDRTQEAAATVTAHA